MSKKVEKKRDFFWLSYSDLMTSLFFVMLVLFVLVYSMQASIIGQLDAKNSELTAAKEELDRIKEIENTVNNIDKKYFSYDSLNKKHILNVNFLFGTEESSMDKIYDPERRKSKRDLLLDLKNAGKVIQDLALKFPDSLQIKYLLVIEGQASNDRFFIDETRNNDVLSYHRAQSLLEYWKQAGLNMDKIDNLEIIVAGSGEKGIPRTIPDKPPANQRFLITIIPKIGEMKRKT